jgi:ParB-like chromosome segregation protein Spo0J
VPEHIQSHLDEIHKTAEAAEAAIKADNTELATELKAKLKHLFENAPEDAKTGGFVGSGGNNIPVPPKDGTSQDLSTRIYLWSSYSHLQKF